VGDLPIDSGRRSGRLLLHDSFRSTIDAIRKAGVRLPRVGGPCEMDFGWVNSYPPEVKVTPLEPVKGYGLDARMGQTLMKDSHTLVTAYDESINKFNALEGTAYFTSHSLVFVSPTGYEPLNLLSMHFYTRSRDLQARSEYLKYSTNPSKDSQMDYLHDKLDFILTSSVSGSILLVDGPIIAGDVYTTFMSSVPQFTSRSILPVFFVKNSDSNMVVDNFADVGGSYNSDLHWSYETLKPGQRSAFFRYVDLKNARNSKIFCYVKPQDVSPVRVEFFVESFEKNSASIPPIMNMLHYLTIVQGDIHNPQVRPIAIAEMYARETLKLVSFQRLMRESGLHPTMNQERFAW
jgi:hypothetical protein